MKRFRSWVAAFGMPERSEYEFATRGSLNLPAPPIVLAPEPPTEIPPQLLDYPAGG